MINAFALEKARLIRLDDGDENLNAAIWIDLLEPSSEEREMLQQGLGQSLASFLELEDIEASARFFEDEDGLHLHSFFIVKMKMIMLILPVWRLLCVMGVYSPCVIVNCLHSAFIECVRVANDWWNVTPMKCY